MYKQCDNCAEYYRKEDIHTCEASIVISSEHMVQIAYHAWMNGSAYIDDNGNYRVKPLYKTSGSIAKWNKLVKSLYSNVSQFSLAAKRSIDHA